MARFEKKENNIFNLSFLKIANRKLRYVIVGPSHELNVETPLFLGIDLLSQSGIAKSNQCRIHSRYSKKGLATKIFFPEGISMGGISNCQSGVWFYNVQGVFKLIFEHQNRQCQLKLTSVLFDIWQSPKACPNLPEKITLSLSQLCLWQDSSLFHPSMEQVSNIDGSPLVPIDENTDSASSLEEPQILEETWTDEEADTNEEDFDLPGNLGASPLPQDTPYSLWWLTGEIIHRVEAHGRTCPSKEKFLTRALVSFLKLVCDASNLYSIRDGVLTSFFKLIVDYASLSHNASKIRHFGTSWGIVDARQNALLCLVSEWLGKYMNSFGDAIAERVLKFKTENLDLACDLPPAEAVVNKLFPECMRLLIGYWIGIFESQSQTMVLDSSSQQKHRLMVKHGNRADHSYFSQKENYGSSATLPITVINNRADHSYFLSSAIVSNTDLIETSNEREDSSYKDHTYKARNGKSVQVANATSRDTRKDHTYVTKKDSQIENCDATFTGGGGSSPLHSKRFRPSETKNPSSSEYSGPVLNDNSKYSVVQLVLEFLNNSLVSGVAHVVYTRLINV